MREVGCRLDHHEASGAGEGGGDDGGCLPAGQRWCLQCCNVTQLGLHGRPDERATWCLL